MKKSARKLAGKAARKVMNKKVAQKVAKEGVEEAAERISKSGVDDVVERISKSGAADDAAEKIASGTTKKAPKMDAEVVGKNADGTANKSTIPDPGPEPEKKTSSKGVVGKRTRKYMDDKFSKNLSDVDNLFDSEGKLVTGATESIMKEFRMDESLKDELQKNMVKGKDPLKKFIGRQKDNYIQSSNIVDSAFAHRVPQIAGSAVATSWLVQNMSDNRGRQSNSQLYNQ